MDKQQAIAIIESTYPADSIYCSTQIKGLQLLDRAKRETNDWRDLPEATLLRYAQLCEEEERRTERNANRNRAYYSYGTTQATHISEALEDGD